MPDDAVNAQIKLSWGPGPAGGIAVGPPKRAQRFAAPSIRLNRRSYQTYLDSLRQTQHEIHDKTDGTSSLVVNE